jgi:hypothetical protein
MKTTITLTLDQAINSCPPIACSMPSIDLSNRYKIISTKNVLEQAISDGWKILETYKSGNKVTSQHFVLMAHDVILNNDILSKHCVPFICLTNSHNGRNSFKYTLGYYSFTNNIKIFTEDAYMENCIVNHNKHNENDALLKLNQTKIYFRSFFDTLKTFENKFLTEFETRILESYSNKISKKNIKIEYNEENSLWKISNIVHNQLGKSFKTNMKFSQEFWRAMCSCLIFTNETLNQFLLKNE